MTKSRRDGLYLLLIGSAIFILLGAALEHSSPFAMMDFKVVYWSSRCLIQHCDPYREAELRSVIQSEGGVAPTDSPKVLSTVSVCVYPPNAFAVTAPFALLPFGLASALWMALTLAGIVFASFLMWSVGADSAPVVSGALAFILLANSELLVIVGNAAGIVVSLCVIAVWCFVRRRFQWAGVFALAVALILKPQDAGLVWLYFLLAGAAFRKRALQTLAVAAALSIPAFLFTARVAPQWMPELRSNLAAVSAHGGNNDPGPSSSGAHGLGAVTELQAAISFFRDDPRFYNPVSYAICSALVLAWAFRTFNLPASPRNAWLALAAIAPLTMLPVYHRQYDARLLLLAIPACAMLWAQGRVGRFAVLFTSLALLANGDIPSLLIIGLITSLHLPPGGIYGQLTTAAQVFPSPLSLLAMACFFLVVYMRRESGSYALVEAPAPADRPRT
jgi:hypothetical protein